MNLSVWHNFLSGAQSDIRCRKVADEDEFQFGIKICHFCIKKKVVSVKVEGLYAEPYYLFRYLQSCFLSVLHKEL